MTAIRWVMFDWGNVLVDYQPLGFPKLAQRLSVELDPLVDAMREATWLDRLCTGEASPEAFVAWLCERFGTPITPAEVCDLFAADVQTRLPGIEPIVGALQGRVRLAILSNTFFAHFQQLLSDPFYAAFDLPMASHLLGAQKPSALVFERALARLEAAPGEVVFIDDGEAHVTAARALGLQAVHAVDVQATRTGLTALGLL